MLELLDGGFNEDFLVMIGLRESGIRLQRLANVLFVCYEMTKDWMQQPFV